MNNPNYEIRTAGASEADQLSLGYDVTSPTDTVISNSEPMKQHRPFVSQRSSPDARFAKYEQSSSNAKSRLINRVGIIGINTSTINLALRLVSADIPVTVFDIEREAIEGGIELARVTCQTLVAKTELIQAMSDRRLGLLVGTCNFHHLKDCDFIVDAVYADDAFKNDIFQKLDEIAKPGAIFALNVEDSKINRIKGLRRRAGDVLGLRFASVENTLEIAIGNDTSAEAIATTIILGKKIDANIVCSGSSNGLAAEQVTQPYGVDYTSLVKGRAEFRQTSELVELSGFD